MYWARATSSHSNHTATLWQNPSSDGHWQNPAPVKPLTYSSSLYHSNGTNTNPRKHKYHL